MEIGFDNEATKGELIHVVLLVFLSCFAMKLPCIVNRRVDEPSEAIPPPFLPADRDAIALNILIHSIDATHVVVVLLDDIGYRDCHLNTL